jgi:hypothetical protein
MSAPPDVAATIRSFFSSVRGPSLELSDGWFGRPYDNAHTLDEVEVLADRVVVRLDELQVLTLHPDCTAEVEGRVLTLGGFVRATWEWTAYGSLPARRQVRELPPGPIRFHGS